MNRVLAYDIDHRASKRILRIQKIIKRAMKLLELKQHEVHINLLKDADIQALNRQYRKKSYVPDVLSFEQKEMISSYFFLGDILISPKKASAQAKQQQHRVKDELSVLSIHGLLHLLGYDHQTQGQADEMFDLQKKIFSKTKHYT